MIHHISIAADNPLHVAQVLAEVCQGQVGPFPPNPGSYIVLALDEFGTMIEVYPRGTEIVPGMDDDQVSFRHNPLSASLTSTHAAISVPLTQDAIERIAAREGWRVLACNRDGLFELVEFWVENTVLIELLPPSMAPTYLSFMQPQNLQRFFAEAAAAAC